MTAAPDGTSEQPNVLFIITDQQRADHAGFAGNDIIRTPYLDSLAARGMVFDNAWVANPVCMPNRSTIMTGRMPSAHGVVSTTGRWSPVPTPTSASFARRATAQRSSASRTCSTACPAMQ